MTTNPLYRDSLALLTDLYQLTMAQGYWKQGIAERSAVFHLAFRRCPFDGQFAVACGLRAAAELLDQFEFREDDLTYLESLKGSDNRPLFDPAFLAYLGDLSFHCDVDAMAEGTAVFPHEPLVRVQGPLLQGQLLETPLLTMLNFPTLVATKAARICSQTAGESVLEFGLRRAQGPDGGVSASRAAFIGGCAATSNCLAGKLFDIPVRGTHAHSWVMAFEDERMAFDAYANAMPNNCIFLVDTYDTVQGVKNAIDVARRLRSEGHEMIGVRLDSGDLAELSQRARRLLDEAGFEKALVVASSDLDEFEIERLHAANSRINVWGVGTRLATAYDCPALGGVYKLSALADDQGRWRYRVKLSEQMVKTSEPGVLQVRRYYQQGKAWGDLIFDEPMGLNSTSTLTSWDGEQQESPPHGGEFVDLLQPLYREGQRVADLPTELAAQSHCRREVASLDESITQLRDATPYRTGLESNLFAVKQDLIREARTGREDT